MPNPRLLSGRRLGKTFGVVVFCSSCINDIKYMHAPRRHSPDKSGEPVLIHSERLTKMQQVQITTIRYPIAVGYDVRVVVFYSCCINDINICTLSGVIPGSDREPALIHSERLTKMQQVQTTTIRCRSVLLNRDRRARRSKWLCFALVCLNFLDLSDYRRKTGTL